jgi:hypothetical protein
MIDGEVTKDGLQRMFSRESSALPINSATVKKIEQAERVLYGWDHTGDPDKKIAGDPQEALQELSEISDTISALKTGGDGDKRDAQIDEILADFDTTRDGFAYRQEHNLQSLYGQREQIRAELHEMLKNPDAHKRAGDLMTQLRQQPDGVYLYDHLQKEYHLVQELMEEASDSDDDDFTLDRSELRNRFYTQTQGLAGDVSFARLIPRYEQAKSIGRNIDMIAPLLELQGAGRDLSEMNDRRPKVEQEIFNKIVQVITAQTYNLRRAKVGTFGKMESPDNYKDILDKHQRIEAAIKDLQAESEVHPDEGEFEDLNTEYENIRQEIKKKRANKKSVWSKLAMGVRLVNEEKLDEEIRVLNQDSEKIWKKIKKITDSRKALGEWGEKADSVIEGAREFLQTLD